MMLIFVYVIRIQQQPTELAIVLKNLRTLYWQWSGHMEFRFHNKRTYIWNIFGIEILDYRKIQLD